MPLALAVTLALWALGPRLSGNFHAVEPGLVHRAARPAPADLRRWTEIYGPRGVLNLRGAHPEAAWYRAKRATTGTSASASPISASRRPGTPGPGGWPR